MSICSTGISGPKAGVPAAIFVDAAYVQGLLPAGLAALYPYLGYMHGLEIGDVGAFCLADPPTWSVPSAVEFFAFLTGGALSDYLTVERFLQDLTKAYLWHSICECKSTGTPAPPSAPTLPTDLPAVNPAPYVTLPPTAPCRTEVMTQATQAAGVGPTAAGLLLHEPGLQATSIRITSVIGASTGNFNVTIEARHQTYYSPVSTGPIETWTQGVGTQVHDVPFNAEFPSLAIYLTGGAGTGVRLVDVTADYYCGGDRPGGTVTPCCPPDPLLTAKLNSILEMVTLIQRQSVPFSYIHGTSHPGLSGEGSFSVQGILGLAVSVTTLPSRAGSVEGIPDTLFDIGWLNLGTEDGWLRRQRITSTEWLLLPEDMSVITEVGYTIPADVEITIDELVREP